MSGYSYYILDREKEEDARPVPFQHSRAAAHPRWAAGECARKWNDEFGGSEVSRPQIVVLLRDGVEVSRWRVTREERPEFVAEKIEGK